MAFKISRLGFQCREHISPGKCAHGPGPGAVEPNVASCCRGVAPPLCETGQACQHTVGVWVSCQIAKSNAGYRHPPISGHAVLVRPICGSSSRVSTLLDELLDVALLAESPHAVHLSLPPYACIKALAQLSACCSCPLLLAHWMTRGAWHAIIVPLH
jgi:hypothetical protein